MVDDPNMTSGLGRCSNQSLATSVWYPATSLSTSLDKIDVRNWYASVTAMTAYGRSDRNDRPRTDASIARRVGSTGQTYAAFATTSAFPLAKNIASTVTVANCPAIAASIAINPGIAWPKAIAT